MGSILGQEDLLEEEMATHSSILAWKIPWTQEPGSLQSMGETYMHVMKQQLELDMEQQTGFK